ncbi:MAG: YjbQ family protein [Oscillospiraceae bacterium]|nr:YjbQ family protein [Oscillospiraceae bacterium]
MIICELNTRQNGFYAITAQVREALAQSGIREGLCTVYCPHTTAGICINENADPDVQRDLAYAFGETFPDRAQFRHFEGNSAAHLQAVVTGASETVPVSDGKLMLGRWQGIYFAEFDGPRSRKFYVQVVGR